MSKETFVIERRSETLQITSEGKFQLEIEGVTHFIKQLTPKQAKDWFEKRYSKDSWEEVIKEANEWLDKRHIKPHQDPVQNQ